ncbi:hypothetical protein POM88_032784 [Heracleum sosnowskyi]|uniref:Uncharacterized protein n=1 Tax=Heracleum sosnowskyi TaxID=360622 RepID=A0AAD8MKE0_9APIA|nr:hypothetical protein POM88_032784 [Heracleum sosnowskyi]
MEFQQGYTRPPPPPPPDNQSWYSGQFQFNNNSSHSPSPNQHWAPPPPPPPPQHAPPYPAQHPYPPPQQPNGSYHPPMPHSYPPQEWHNSGWNQNQGLQYPVHNNGEDWAAKAREWAAAQSSSDNQYPQAQYASVGRVEENQYSISNPQYADGQHSSYPQYQPSIAPSYQSSEPSFSSEYVPDGHLPFNGRHRSVVGESNAAFPHQESSPLSSSVHQQEVPSSYSSVAGKEDFADQNKQFYKSPWAFSSTAQQQAQPAAVHRTVSMEQPHYAFSHQSADPPSDPSDQPLEFVPGFSRDHEQRVQSTYSQNSGLHVRGTDSPAVASVNSWNADAAPGVVYPPVHTPGSQVDPSLAIASPVPGHSGPLFGRISGQNFQPMGPSVVPFGGTGAFLGDGFVASGVPDRPKKPSVPNWMRDELIKKKLRSIDSSRSTEEEDDEEDDVEIARTAAINHEIKRVLTEVLLKVTDELFDEIASKVLSEEGTSISRKDHEISTPAPAVPIPKASAKVLITDDTRKSTSSAPGDLLGLGSYATDDDEEDDIQNIRVPNSKRNTIHQPSTIKIHSDNISVAGNDLSVANTKDTHKNNSVLERHSGRIYPNGSSENFKPDNKPTSHGSGKEYMHGTLGPINSFKTDMLPDDHGVTNGVEVVSKADSSMLKENTEKAGTKTELSVESVGAKGTSDNTKAGEAINKSVKNDRYNRKGSPGKDIVKEVRDDRGYVEGSVSNRRQEERKVKKERTDDRGSSKEKSVDADSKRRSGHRDKKEIVETEKDGRTRGKEGYERKRDGTKDERGERSRDKDSNRHKRRRSSSVGSRGRDRKNHEVVSRTKDSSDDESEEDSRRKSRSRKRKSSPSPVRSRRRQVSRSPHSKHSQHRHSPYSSLETTRGKRSRSRSPARRKR